MNKIAILLLFSVFNTAFSQNGKVYLKNAKFNAGIANTYVYEPPKGLIILDNSKVNIASVPNGDYSSESNQLMKNGLRYEFTIKLADSARVFFATISDVKKIADNNNGKGYVVYLKTENKSELSKTLANEISTRAFANYSLKLKLDAKPQTAVKDYEKLFLKYPNLKNDKCYLDYLYEKENSKAQLNKKDFVAFAAKCLKKNNEEYLMLAFSIYERNDMQQEKEKLEKEILARYPLGKLAKRRFIDGFFAHQDKTEDYILESINICETKYNDVSKRTLMPLYHSLMLLYLDNQNFEKAKEIETHFYDPSGLYNQAAWNLCGEDITSPMKNGEFAAKISKRSLDIIDEKKRENYDAENQDLYNTYADTYALILYKQGNYDEAFKYQNAVYNLGGLDTGGKERYLAMMQKVKSNDEVKLYIEKEINTKGITSPLFLTALKEVYIAKNLPLDEYEKLKQKTQLAAKTARDKEITGKFGSLNAPDFVLKNIEGKEIKLSDYKGKIVVLDFWATWCGPCVASFPKMQELVTKYKDKNVEFLFVNTWEKGEESKISERVINFITDKKYNFNVIFDSTSKVTDNYKVKGIPTKIVIDKDGSILSADASDSNIGTIIEEHLK